MNSLPAEILIHILDDRCLTFGDLAALSRVSRLWHEAAIPRLYEQYTFRFSTQTDPHEESWTKLPSFKKHGKHVKSLVFHTLKWTSLYELKEGSTIEDDSDLIKAFNILDNFPNLKFVEYYELCGIGWTDFWVILHHFLRSKPHLVDITIRRCLPYTSLPPVETDLQYIVLEPLTPIPTLRSFKLRIMTRTKQSVSAIPYFLKGLKSSIGASCQDALKFELEIDLFKDEKDQPNGPIYGIDEIKLPLEKVKDLGYTFLGPVAPSPFQILEFEPSNIATLRLSYNIFKACIENKLDMLKLESTSFPELVRFTNVKTLYILEEWTGYPSYHDDMKNSLAPVVNNLPQNLVRIILDDYSRLWVVDRSTDAIVLRDGTLLPLFF